MERADLTLTAGPNDVYPEVRAALGAPILYHYDPVFLERFRETEAKLARIFRTTSHEIVLMQGEAVLGLESAARSLCTRGTPVLNLVSGVFGKGFGYWLTALGADLHEIEVPYDEAIDADAVAAYLDAHPDIKVLSVVHSETPSGTLNPVDRLGPICRSRGVVSIVDVGLIAGRRRAALRGVAAGPAGGRPPEVPRRPARHVADGRQPAGVGGHRGEPRRAPGLLPVDARPPRHVARPGPLPVHAVRVRPPRRPRGG